MTTGIQRIALIFGIGFIAAALAGFFATGMSNMDPDPATAPRALGLFPVNVLHNIAHLRADRRRRLPAPRGARVHLAVDLRPDADRRQRHLAAPDPRRRSRGGGVHEPGHDDDRDLARRDLTGGRTWNDDWRWRSRG